MECAPTPERNHATESEVRREEECALPRRKTTREREEEEEENSKMKTSRVKVSTVLSEEKVWKRESRKEREDRGRSSERKEHQKQA